MNAIKGEKGGS